MSTGSWQPETLFKVGNMFGIFNLNSTLETERREPDLGTQE